MQEKELLEVGDYLIVDNQLFKPCKYKIARVTKTLAITESGLKFKRIISHDMAHPYRQWNITTYKVIKKEDEDEK